MEGHLPRKIGKSRTWFFDSSKMGPSNFFQISDLAFLMVLSSQGITENVTVIQFGLRMIRYFDGLPFIQKTKKLLDVFILKKFKRQIIYSSNYLRAMKVPQL